MLYRKISVKINEYLKDDNAKILCIYGARQIGKSYIIRECAKKFYKNYIEINLADDFNGEKIFKNTNTIDMFYIQLSVVAGNKLGDRENTIIFLDEIQVYPHLLTLLKPLYKDNKYKYICSGSELGLSLKETILTPMGSIEEMEMFPLDFEEFLIANNIGEDVIKYLEKCYKNNIDVESSIHDKIFSLFKMYLCVGGLPEAVNEYVNTKNIVKIKKIQSQIRKFYSDDAAKYDTERKLKVKTIYDLVISNIKNKVKRINYSSIENKKGARFIRYEDEFDYLISSGIVLDAKAVSEPKFPLVQSSNKNLIKLYMNDVGILTDALYKNNINAILDNKSGVNLGAVYETVVAIELRCHGHNIYYYDRRKVGEVDYIIDDYENLSILPIEVKSGQDFSNFRALPRLLKDKNYRINKAYVLNNSNTIKVEDKVIYAPIYFVMFM